MTSLFLGAVLRSEAQCGHHSNRNPTASEVLLISNISNLSQCFGRLPLQIGWR